VAPEEREVNALQSELTKINSRNRTAFRESEDRRAHMIQLLATGMSVTAACDEVGVRPETHRHWRLKYPQYATRVDATRIEAAGGDLSAMRHGQKTMDFGTFRKQILGMSSPWFHLEAVKWLESSPPGSVTMMLWPPEHGKTTLLEDFCTWKLAMDPSYRIGIGSGRQAHSSKVLRRVQNRMEDNGPFPELIRRYGPFAPQTGLGNRKAIQAWGSNFFRVYLAQGGDERDFSMTALGITADVVGSRMDLLVLDDTQSIRTLDQTDKYVNVIRQDWLSRPGSKGRTVIIGTRVGEKDVYSELEKAGIIDKLILFRAHDSDGQWLWPERYSPEEYAIMRRNVGESGWERNYMQRATIKGERTFTEEMTEAAANPMRSVLHDPPDNASGVVIGLDPGFGINVTLAAAVTTKRLIILGGRQDDGLTSNQAIFGVVEEVARSHTNRDVPWLHLVMEDKAFQKGLFGDEGLARLRERHGFTVGGHQTGINKYDPNLGIAAMARSFSRNEIEIPGGDDPATTRFREALVTELHAWRPNMRGTRLKQDYVMALWFMWMWWQRHRDALVGVGAADFTFGGLPYGPTNTGLVLPTGPYGKRTA
jgi:hypothetical protein